MATDKQVLANLDFEAKAPAIMCMVTGTMACPSRARHSITCMGCGAQMFVCSAHRLMMRPQELVCTGVWYEAVIS